MNYFLLPFCVVISLILVSFSFAYIIQYTQQNIPGELSALFCSSLPLPSVRGVPESSGRPKPIVSSSWVPFCSVNRKEFFQKAWVIVILHSFVSHFSATNCCAVLSNMYFCIMPMFSFISSSMVNLVPTSLPCVRNGNPIIYFWPFQTFPDFSFERCMWAMYIELTHHI